MNTKLDEQAGWKKRITHFTFEFLMIFLAVFCGFLAENQRETMSENQMEKDYIISLTDDIKKDSTEVQAKIAGSETVLRNIDSLLLYLYENPPAELLPPRFQQMNLKALSRLQIIMEDRTALLLKNAGGMRLIRKPKVSDAVLAYWKRQELMLTSLDRYIIYRNHAREFSEQLFSSSESYLNNRGLIKAGADGYRVIRKDPVLWNQYENIVSRCGVVVSGLIRDLRALAVAAENLKQTITKEYPKAE